jgi:hypothetical protein
MLGPNTRVVTALITLGCVGTTMGAAAALGVLTSGGSVKLDGHPVSGSATVFGGALIETGQSSSRLQIRKQTRVELAPGSRAKVLEDRVALEAGASDFSSPAGYRLEALRMLIASDAKSVASVKYDGEKTVLVAALNGPVQIFTADGLLMAKVNAGMALSLTPDPAQAGSSALTGCVVRRDGAFLLNDPIANITVELRGDGLDQYVGKRVEASGTPFRSATGAAGASQVIRVTTIKQVEGACAAEPAGVQAPRPKPGAAPKSTSHGAIIAVVVVGAGAAAAIPFALKGSKSR